MYVTSLYDLRISSLKWIKCFLHAQRKHLWGIVRMPRPTALVMITAVYGCRYNNCWGWKVYVAKDGRRMIIINVCRVRACLGNDHASEGYEILNELFDSEGKLLVDFHLTFLIQNIFHSLNAFIIKLWQNKTGMLGCWSNYWLILLSNTTRIK